ncbi:kinase-like protein [Suillus hirtellus]|nr:kinase-like protein [Suillus hirtellus]
MAHSVTEDSESNGTDLMRWLRVNLLPSFSYFPRENVTTGNGSDDSKAVLDSPPSGTDPESSYVTSGSLSTFGDSAVACEVPSCESDLRSSSMQHCPKMEVDFKRYGEEPENLTTHISRTQKYPHSNGGFGNIWKCILKNSFLRNGTKVSPQDVAVKSLIVQSRRPEDIQALIKKLRQEVFVWQKLEHRHILPLYGIADDFDVLPALVCPWMKNGSLSEYLDTMWCEQQQPPKMHILFLLLSQVVLGLQYLHSKNIIHGDLMPPNVLIDENGDARLADFGLSRLLADHETSFFASYRSGAIRCAAPEIIPLDLDSSDECASKPNEASDIYSFGCIMMQVLSGRIPYFDMKAEPRVIVAKSKGILPTRPPSPVIADDHWYYIEQCWSTQIEMRPSVDQVLDYIKGEHDKFKQV